MPDIRIKPRVETYIGLVSHAAELGLSEAQYATLVIEGVAQDEDWERALVQRGMDEKVAAAQRRAAGIVKKHATVRKRGLFG